MLRVIGFFLLVFLLAAVLGNLPVIGPVFRHTGPFGILLTSTLLSAALTWAGKRLLVARKLRSEVRALGAVGNAHGQGKIGALYLARRRARAALPHLEAAASGEPEVAEWHYRLGLARLATGDAGGGLEALDRCVTLDEEHAYGAAQMRRAQCMQALGRGAQALEVLAVVERNHGPSAESAYRRGLALRSLGRRAEARAAFGEVVELARHATRYQRRSASWWALRANLARLV